MRPLAALLALLLAAPAGAQEDPLAADVERAAAATDAALRIPERLKAAEAIAATVRLPSGAQAEVAGGCWLREDVCLARAREVARYRAERKQARRDVVLLVAGALVLGAAAGFAAARLVR